MKTDVSCEVIAEMYLSELRQPSGVFDELTDKELTNREFVTALALHKGAFDVFTSMNGHLSPEAAAHNSTVTRSRQGEHIVALVAKYQLT